ncbi:MAG: glycoside hydrolase family 88 protein [Candidatus Aminicenantes bacterium]|nr:MAG: glycoside hydrolase family 88 protein [Candidatus Aminicenantes bacterium]
MERRNFLTLVLSCGIFPLAIPNQSGKRISEFQAPEEIALVQEKVKRAMLCMQRYAWEQGVAAQALLERGDTKEVILMAKDAVLRQQEDGRLAVVSSFQGVTDPAANGESVLYAARVTDDPILRSGAEKMLDYLLHRAPRTKEGTLHHIADKPQVWIDSAHMAPPFLAVAGHPDEAVKQIEGFRKLLWNRDRKLFSHIWDERKNDFYRKDFWGVGNGWAAAGITRVIRSLPTEMSAEKELLVGYVKDVIDGCLAHQRKDGLFHDVVDKSETFVETNLAQMLAYAIYRGLQGEWLDQSYKDHADRMRKAVLRKVDKFGLVQDVCGAPNFNSPGTAVEGQAFFLLMEAAAMESAY